MNRTRNRNRQAAGPHPKVIAVVAGVVALVVAVGMAIALSGDGDDDGDFLNFGSVHVDGEPLPVEGAGPDVGLQAPTLEGEALDGSEVTVELDEPTLLVFLAHWCPHCQAELPRLVQLQEAGDLDGVRAVAVLTGTRQGADNFPPGAWLQREGWTGDVLVDDEAGTAAAAYGLRSYPYLVAVGADGSVVARTSGEHDIEVLRALVGTIG